MRIINPKCRNEYSFKYSILISIHYFELNNHRERINQLNKYMHEYNFINNIPINFEKNNSFILLCIYDECGKILYNSINNSNIKASIVKINNRYHALKPNEDKYIKINNILKQFVHKELTEFILKKIIQ